jgi:hypothetical protein
MLLVAPEPPAPSSGLGGKFQVFPKVLLPPEPVCPDKEVVFNPPMLANGFAVEVAGVELLDVPKMLPAWVVGAVKILLLAGPLDAFEVDPKMFVEPACPKGNCDFDIVRSK